MNEALPPLAYTTPSPISTDQTQLNLLAIFHWVVGGVLVLVGCVPIVHVMIGFLILTGRFGSMPTGNGQSWFGLLFVAMGLLAIAIIWAMGISTICSGFFIKQRRRRMFSIVIAAILCMMFPIGTALGVFSLIVLFRSSVDALYLKTARTPVTHGIERTRDV